jgi:hypothetical protein
MERRPRDRRRLTTRRRPSAAVTPALADHHRNPHGGKAVLTGPSFVGTGRAGWAVVVLTWTVTGRLTWVGAESALSRAIWAAVRPTSSNGTVAEVSPSSKPGSASMSSKPVTETSSGTFRPALVSSWKTPRATESTTAATAVKGMPFWSACRMACRPDSAVKLPGVRVLRAWAVRRLPSRTGGLPAVVGYSDVEVARRRRGCLDGPD